MSRHGMAVFRRHLAVWTAVAVAATLLVAAPAQAMPGRRPDKPKVPAAESVPGGPVPVRQRAPGAEEAVQLRQSPAVNWPAKAAVGTVSPGDRMTNVDGIPISVQAQGKASPAAVRLGLIDRSVGDRLGVSGLLFEIARADATGEPAPLSVEVDYAGFRDAFGGDWATRLQLWELPACALTTPGVPRCQEAKLVPSRNDTKASRVRADISVTGGPADKPWGALAGNEVSERTAGTVLALAAASSGNAGTFQATPLAPSLTWQVGLQSGDFLWGYPIDVPEMPGMEPVVGLNYSSGNVDGRMVSTNNQPSVLGEGFAVQGGFIERSYQTCKEDGQAESNELCWISQNAIISMPEVAGELVRDYATGAWHAEDDDGWRVELLTGASNGDDNGEHWKLTSPDGVQYFFGLNRRPGWTSAGAETNSAWTAPVYGNNSGEPCHAGSFAASWCQQAYRWNLDYVVDPHGDAMSYFYDKEGNHYKRGTTVTPYTRAGYLTRIEYGQRADSLFTTTAPGRVVYSIADRCIAGTVCTQSQPQNWPDVPWDQHCDASTCLLTGPSFWTTKRVSAITTQVYHNADYRDVDSYELSHLFPASGDNTNAGLWLDSIVRKGHVGGTAIALPPITFDGIARPNRVDAVGDAAPMYKWRLETITNETGGQVGITYAAQDCTRATLPAPDSNTRLCYPAFWQQGGTPDPTIDWFHKTVVIQVAETDLVGGGPTALTQYEYLGGAAWHHDDSELTPARMKTWGQSRGFSKVRVRTGDPGAGPQTLTEHLFMRGMDNDRLTTGFREVLITDSEGGVIEDKNPRRGFARETIVYNGVGGDWVSKTISEPLEVAKTASRDRTSGKLEAYLNQQRSVRELTKLSTGAVQEARTVFGYDERGRQIEVNDLGDVSTAGDDTCTRTWYASNVSAWILDDESRTQTVGVRCETTPTFPADLLAETRFFYDGATSADSTPSKGDLTRTETASGWNAGGAVFAPGDRNVYDVHGRMIETYDSLGNKSTMSYTPAVGGPLTALTAVNSLGHTSTSTIDPFRKYPTSVVDANNRRTEMTYDALGRITAAWQAGRDRASGQSPTAKFSYLVRANGPTVTSTSALLAGGGYATSHVLHDGFLRTRQTQGPSPVGGRIVSDTFYDTHGRVSKVNDQYWNSGPPAKELLLVADLSVDSQTRYVFDGAGRESAEALYSRGVEKWRTTTAYGGNWVAVTPAAGDTATMTVTDVDGKVTELRQFHGATPTGTYDATRYGYDKAGRLTDVTDAAGNVWRHGYDLRGRKIRDEDPDSGVSTFTYDDEGQLLSGTDSRGFTVSTTYDALGRRTAVRAGGILAAQWAYDSLPGGKGMPAAATRFHNGAPYVTSIAGYDGAGNPTGEVSSIPAAEGALAGSYAFTFTYNEVGQVVSATRPALGGLPAETIAYGYEPVLGLPASMIGHDTYVSEVMHDELGRTSVEAFGDPGKQVWRSFAFDPATGRMTRASADSESASDPFIADVGYRYDAAGNVLSIVDSPEGVVTDAQCFQHDYLRRMTAAWTPQSGNCSAAPSTSALGGPAPYWHSYTYDKAGNRLSEVQHAGGGDVQRNYTYPPAGSAQPHTLLSVVQSGPAGSRTDTFGYDSQGNTTSRTVDGVQQSLVWDAEGNLASVTTGSVSTSYVYDTEGQRLIQRDHNGTTLYLGGDELRLEGTVVTGTRYYAHEDESVGVRKGGKLYWLIADHHGTAGHTIDAATLDVTTRRSLPFGAPRGPQPSAWPGDRGFVGGTKDSSTGLTRLGAREYDPVTGRFLSVDPLIDIYDPQQMHGYAYGNNNPATFSDPDGLAPKCSNPRQCDGSNAKIQRDAAAARARAAAKARAEAARREAIAKRNRAAALRAAEKAEAKRRAKLRAAEKAEAKRAKNRAAALRKAEAAARKAAAAKREAQDRARMKNRAAALKAAEAAERQRRKDATGGRNVVKGMQGTWDGLESAHEQQKGKFGPKGSWNAKVDNFIKTASKAASGPIGKTASKAVPGLGLMVGTNYHLQNGDSAAKATGKAAVEEGIGWAGAAMGGAVGAVLGGPAGAFVGALAGKYIGSMAGKTVAKWIFG